jgi:ornithine carbamoyltransferase
MKRDFLRLADLSLAEHEALFARAAVLKADRAAGRTHATLAGRTLALLFEKPSTRTRLSFEAAIHQLGGHAISIDAQNSQLSRGEPPVDTARVVSRYADAVMLRTFADERLDAFARAATIPVINGLSDGAHPVQLLADLLTMRERFGSLEGRRVAFVGDGASNMARSWIEAAGIFSFELRIAAPLAYWPYRPDESALGGGARVRLVADAKEAARGADVLATDVWTSMGQEEESARRRRDLAAYTVDEALLAEAGPGAIVLHCLPAHRGEEIAAAVIDHPRSAIFDEAENRLHTQKALLEKLMQR